MLIHSLFIKSSCVVIMNVEHAFAYTCNCFFTNYIFEFVYHKLIAGPSYKHFCTISKKWTVQGGFFNLRYAPKDNWAIIT